MKSGFFFKLPAPNKSSLTTNQGRELHKFDGDLENFEKHLLATNNKFLRERLYYRQHGLCPYCRNPLPGFIQNTCVHHQEYSMVCNFDGEMITVCQPRKSYFYEKEVPNCEVCFFTHPEYAERCMDNLLLLHSECHKKLHGFILM